MTSVSSSMLGGLMSTISENKEKGGFLSTEQERRRGGGTY